jgi:alcohol-forming fatty acyl-CoA reductase
MKIQKKIINGMAVTYYFSLRHFNFRTKKLKNLFNELDDDDRKAFNFDHGSIDLEDYSDKACLGGRRYILKEDDSTLPKAQAYMRKLYFADWALKIFLIVFFSCFFAKFLF